jgi:hypothetical protein
MNIPNLITLLRIILVPIIVILLIQGFFLKALIVFVVAGLSDALDGFLARVLHQQTVLGAYLDPIADKALLASSFVTLSILHIIPSWLAVIVISRDFHHVDFGGNPPDFHQQGYDSPAVDHGPAGPVLTVSALRRERDVAPGPLLGHSLFYHCFRLELHDKGHGAHQSQYKKMIFALTSLYFLVS